MKNNDSTFETKIKLLKEEALTLGLQSTQETLEDFSISDFLRDIENEFNEGIKQRKSYEEKLVRDRHYYKKYYYESLRILTKAYLKNELEFNIQEYEIYLQKTFIRYFIEDSLDQSVIPKCKRKIAVRLSLSSQFFASRKKEWFNYYTGSVNRDPAVKKRFYNGHHPEIRGALVTLSHSVKETVRYLNHNNEKVDLPKMIRKSKAYVILEALIFYQENHTRVNGQNIRVCNFLEIAPGKHLLTRFPELAKILAKEKSKEELLPPKRNLQK